MEETASPEQTMETVRYVRLTETDVRHVRGTAEPQDLVRTEARVRADRADLTIGTTAVITETKAEAITVSEDRTVRVSGREAEEAAVAERHCLRRS